jgi:NO-binding membrane sensor protein with MHYT domain
MLPVFAEAVLQGPVVSRHYDLGLVLLSVLIAIIASYAALDVAGRIRSAARLSRALWIVGGAIAMGSGIWAMHYVGMLALKLPVAVTYDWFFVLLSIVVAMIASGLGLWIASHSAMNNLEWFAGSGILGPYQRADLLRALQQCLEMNA